MPWTSPMEIPFVLFTITQFHRQDNSCFRHAPNFATLFSPAAPVEIYFTMCTWQCEGTSALTSSYSGKTFGTCQNLGWEFPSFKALSLVEQASFMKTSKNCCNGSDFPDTKCKGRHHFLN